MGLIKQILSCTIERIKIRPNIRRLDMGDWFGGRDDPPPPDTSGIEAVERRNAERDAASKRSIKARQRAGRRSGPLMLAMKDYNTDTAELGATLGPRKRPT